MEEKQVMIMGGGIAGLTAARDLAEFGVNVHLIEKSSFMGGYAIGYTCKASTECLQCGACSVEKTLKEATETPNIEFHLSTTVEAVSSENNKFSAKLKKGPFFIDPERCNNCGLCYEKSPEKGAVLRGYSKNNHPLYAITAEGIQSHRDFFASVCPEGAISVDAKATSETLGVDALIVATGFEPFDPNQKPTYRYAEHANVITGLDMERIKRTHGALVRPSDGQPPEKIAFIQCVGSRDERLGHLWCSRVCCPYALRSAQSIKTQSPEMDITIFYMDIQNIGKNFPEFYQTCKSDFRFIRSIPVDIFGEDNDRLSLRRFDETEGTTVMETFDLVVLSIGIMPNSENPAISKLLGIELDQDGFIDHNDALNQTLTSQNGIFVAGTASGPNSIPGSMAQAGHAAGEVLKYLGVTQ
ncbi:MAG: CoB--CoM heterodisulfide reductase iron-sulfur subunit A family protein [Desulfobacterales bacterium]|nr:CoB--CoM heterodisulfide reductase iron-sulfur subunit A family protein [Desulfobacterales bacterium]